MAGTRKRSERIAAMRAKQRRAERRRNLITAGAVAAVAAVLIGVVVAVAVSRSGPSATHEVLPPAVSGGSPVVVPAAPQVPNTTGIPGVVAYDTTGWPQTSHNGPAAKALGHEHVPGPVTYPVTPPVGGAHNAEWMNCGTYDKPVPNERAVHNLEHGAVWITYSPSLPSSEVSQLRSFVQGQSVLTSGTGNRSRYMDLSPYPGLPAPIVISSWGFQLRVSSPSDPRLQRFVDTFRVSQRYTPEYGAACTGGLGTPLQS